MRACRLPPASFRPIQPFRVYFLTINIRTNTYPETYIHKLAGLNTCAFQLFSKKVDTCQDKRPCKAGLLHLVQDSYIKSWKLIMFKTEHPVLHVSSHHHHHARSDARSDIFMIYIMVMISWIKEMDAVYTTKRGLWCIKAISRQQPSAEGHTHDQPELEACSAVYMQRFPWCAPHAWFSDSYLSSCGRSLAVCGGKSIWRSAQ